MCRKTLVSTLVMTVLLAAGCQSTPRLESSGTAVLAPQTQIPFPDYIAENRRRIRQALEDFYFLPGQEPFRGDYSIDEVVAMRAPYELRPDPSCGEDALGHGILLIHGLSDSPYLTRQVARALKADFPCALVRGVLVPGHGTIPGDLLEVDRDDWRRIADYGVNSFADQVETLTMIGYSNGGPITLDYLNRHPDQALVSELILVVPGLGAATPAIRLTPWLQWILPFPADMPDTDAAKYESLATHAMAEFYHLGNEVVAETDSAIAVPILMLLSGDDSTVDNNRSIDYFCDYADSDQSRLFVFAGEGGTVYQPTCERASVLDFDVDDPRFVSYSHVALMIPPDDPHYGMDGKYPVCLNYLEDAERYENCMANSEDTVYADPSRADRSGLLDGRMLRRPTFNPRFDQMLESMSCFIRSDCRLP